MSALLLPIVLPSRLHASENIIKDTSIASPQYTYQGAKRTQTSEETAIGACAISRATPQNNPIPASNTIIVVPGGNPTTPSTPGGSPKAITDCMKRLMYERKLVCTRSGFPRCSHFPDEGFGGWQTQDVRTDVSEQTAVQACGNAQ